MSSPLGRQRQRPSVVPLLHTEFEANPTNWGMRCCDNKLPNNLHPPENAGSPETNNTHLTLFTTASYSVSVESSSSFL